MTTHEETPASRLGSSQDLARRMDRLEANHETLAREVGNLTGTVARVELNQTHQADLNKLRFDALDTGLGTVKDTLERFMGRIEGMLSGEVETAQSRQGRELVAEYQRWRITVEDRLDATDDFVTQGRFLGRLVGILIGGNALVIIAAIAALTQNR